MKVINRWGRRSIVVAAVCAVAAAFGLSPAAADVPRCRLTHQAYGVTRAGALISNEQCDNDDNHLITRQLAPAGWATGGAVFAGRYGADQASVVYQVSPGGRLLWYSDGGPGGSLGKGTGVGAAFGNWGRFHSLFSPGRGLIYGIDPTGQILRWEHLGWQDGSDTWDGPEVVGQGFGAGRTIVGVGADFFVGTDPARPGTLLYWETDGSVRGDGVPVDGPPGAGPVTWNGSQLGWGRSATGHVLRFAKLHVAPDDHSAWTATELNTAVFARVFAGGTWGLGPRPYEWQ